MKIVCLSLPDELAAEWAGRFRRMRDAGIEPYPVSDMAELEIALRRADVGGSLHIVGARPMTPHGLVALARRHADRLTILAGAVGGVPHDFIAELRASEAELLLVIEDFEDVGSEIRRRVPLWLTRRCVELAVRPVIERGFQPLHSGDEELLDWLLCDSPIVPKGRLRTISDSELRSLNKALTRSGLRRVHEIHCALELLMFMFAVTEVGLTEKEGATACGMSDSRLIGARGARVVGTSDMSELQRMSVEQVLQSVLNYICAAGSHDPVDAIEAPAWSASASAWMEGVLRSAAPIAEASTVDSADPEYNRFFEHLHSTMDTVVTTCLRRRLRDHEQRVEDVMQLVWKAVNQRIADGRIAHLLLTPDGVAGQAAEWQELLTRICRNEAANFLHGVKRRGKLLARLSETDDVPPPWDSRLADPLQALLRKEIADAIEAAVAMLPEKVRVVWVLRNEQHLKDDAIAARLGVSERTVWRRLKQAEATLRETLGPLWDDYRHG